MKVVAVREVKASLSEYIEKSQPDRVLITKHGRPALVIGVEGEDLEDLLTMGNPRFWEMIEDRRRKSRTSTLAEVRAAYGVRRRTVSRGRSGLRRVRSLGLACSTRDDRDWTAQWESGTFPLGSYLQASRRVRCPLPFRS